VGEPIQCFPISIAHRQRLRLLLLQVIPQVSQKLAPESTRSLPDDNKQNTRSGLKPQSKPYFLRSKNLTGFGVKVNPSGTIKFIIETKHLGKAIRKTIGSFPVMSLAEAEQEALATLKYIHAGYVRAKTLGVLSETYLSTVALKPNTHRNYTEVIGFYLEDWLKIPVGEITKEMVEKRFYKIRDKGINGGIPTYSQATKVMRSYYAKQMISIGTNT
jgi:hypothetical protein